MLPSARRSRKALLTSSLLEKFSQQAPDYQELLAELLSSLQQIAIAQAVPGAVDENLEEREAILDLAGRMAPEDVQLYYQIGLIGRRDLQLSPDQRGGLEMVLLRMLAFRPVDAQTIEEHPGFFLGNAQAQDGRLIPTP